MIIKIDNRETELIKSCSYLLEISPSYKNIQLVVANLPIGDIIISNLDTELVIVERKSLRDLAASIKDGRYEEQSYRLNGIAHNNHNIIYLIEGDMNKFNIFKDRMEKMTLYSSMVSLNLYKGFSVIRCINIEETALFLCNMAYKMGKCEVEGRQLFYSNPTSTFTKQQTEKQQNEKQQTENQIQNDPLKEENGISNDEDNNENNNEIKNYCSVVKKVKKENITKENIGEILLCQIPNVSSTTAIAVMSHFNNFADLIISIGKDEQCIKNISYTNAKGQTRKITKTAIQSIIDYLKPNNTTD
jgi:ERCC4-type nuclease